MTENPKGLDIWQAYLYLKSSVTPVPEHLTSAPSSPGVTREPCDRRFDGGIIGFGRRCSGPGDGTSDLRRIRRAKEMCQGLGAGVNRERSKW